MPSWWFSLTTALKEYRYYRKYHRGKAMMKIAIAYEDYEDDWLGNCSALSKLKEIMNDNLSVFIAAEEPKTEDSNFRFTLKYLPIEITLKYQLHKSRK